MKQRLANLSRTELLIMLVAVLYILSPVDLVPEALAGPLGLTDDLAAAVVIGSTMLRSRGSGPVIVADPPQAQAGS